MLAGLSLLAGSSLAFAFGDDIVVLDIARFVQGLGGACAWTAGLAWLIAGVPNDRRGADRIGACGAVAGLLLGPVLGAIATVTGPELVFSAVAVIAVGLAIWALTVPADAPSPVQPLRTVLTGITHAPVLLAAWFVALPSVLAGALDVLAPLRLDELGATGIAVGAVFLVASAVEAVVSPIIGKFSDRRGRMVPIRAGLAAFAAALLIPLPAQIIPLAVGVLVVVVAMSLIWTPAMALLSEEAEAAGVDVAFGTALLSLAWAGGQVIGGSVLSGVADATSDAITYAVIAAGFALTLTLLAMLPPRERVRHGLRVGRRAITSATSSPSFGNARRRCSAAARCRCLRSRLASMS